MRVPVEKIAPFGLRMQPELKAQIEALAVANQRSMNSEIIARLEQSLSGESLSETVKAAVKEAMAEHLANRDR